MAPIGIEACVRIRVGPRRAYRAGCRRHEPPQPAADPRQVRARALSREDPGDPLRDGRLEQGDRPRSRSPARPRPRRPAGARVGAPRDGGRAAATAASARRDGAGRRRGTRPADPARPPAAAPAPAASARPAASTTTSSPSRIADRAATRTASPASSGSAAVRSRPVGIADHGPRRRPPPRPARSTTSARSPPHHGSNRCSSESNGAGQRARQHRPQVREIGQLVGLEAQRELVGHRRLDGSPLDCSGVPTCWRTAVPRPPRPDDLYRLRIATEPRLSPDGRLAVVTLQTVAPGFDGYRHALWLVATDGAAAAAPADPRRAARPPSALLARRADPRVHLGPRAIVEEEPPGRGRDVEDRQGPRGRRARSTCCRSTAARRAG